MKIQNKFIAASIIASTALFAGPPFMTDDPEPVEYKHYELTIATQQVLNQDGRSGTLPHVELNYGATENSHLHIIVPFAFNSPSGETRQRGVGDIELGVKYRLIQETDNVPMVGVFPIVLTQTGDVNKGLGSGGTQLFLPIWFQKKFADGWQTYCGGGYWMSNRSDIKSHQFYGWQVQKELSESLTLGTEIFYSTQQYEGQGSSTGYNIGGTFNINEHNHVLLSAGKGITNASKTNQFSSYVGYQYTW